MAKSLQEILGGRNMTGVIKTVQTGLPNLLPPQFLTPTRTVIGNNGTYFKTTGERRNAKTTQYGAPARHRSQQGLTEVGVTLIHAFEQQNHNPLLLQNLLGTNGEPAQNFAIQEIDRQTAEFKTLFTNLRQSAVYSSLAAGKIYLDQDGVLLYTSTGAVTTIDFSVPTTRTTNGVHDASNTVIGVAWTASTADIIGGLTTAKKCQLQDGKPPLMHAFYGANITSSILTNTKAKELINNNPLLATQLYNTGEIPNGFCGLQWHPVYSAYGLNSSDAVTSWFDPDALVLTPDPTPDWYELVEGTYMIPNDVGAVTSDAIAAASQYLQQVSGMFSYAKVSHNPVTVEQYAGDTFLPIIKDGSAIWILDTTP